MGKRLGYLLIAAVLLIEIPRFVDAYRGIDSTVLTAVGFDFFRKLGYNVHC